MPNRIDRVVTRTGDSGETSLADGARHSKHANLIELVGTLDELNCHIGLLLATPNETVEAQRENLLAVQSRLFDLGGEVALNHSTTNWTEVTQRLEQELTTLQEGLPPLKEFVLPGGIEASARAHLLRAVIRRAERCFWQSADERAALVDADAGKYLNRLSDYLFVLARVIQRSSGAPEITWQKQANPASA